jgi:integrase
VPRRGRRRGRKGDGSIVPVGDRFQARYSWTEGGIRKRKAKTFDLRADAEWWLRQAHRHGTPGDDLTVAAHMERWLAGKRKVAPSTHRQYTEHVRLHIVPVLGGFRLTELRRQHVEAFVEDRLRYVSPSKGKRLSPATVGKVLVTLRSALEEAVPRDIPDNPAAKVESPKVERSRVEAMTPADAAALVSVVRGTWLERPVRVLLGSGMRLGELTALDQGDVHDGWVSLRKSKTTIRAVRLSADADAAIHEAIRQAPRRGAKEPVFYSPRTGDRLRGSSVTHALTKATGISPHKLRHATATLMVRAGVPMRTVAEQLGHANPSLTARTYSHIAPDQLRDAVAVLDEAVKG